MLAAEKGGSDAIALAIQGFGVQSGVVRELDHFHYIFRPLTEEFHATCFEGYYGDASRVSDAESVGDKPEFLTGFEFFGLFYLVNGFAHDGSTGADHGERLAFDTGKSFCQLCQIGSLGGPLAPRHASRYGFTGNVRC